MAESTTTADAADLREKMICELKAAGDLTSPAVEAAMRAVPRHAFVPEADPERAYRPFDAVVTKLDAAGTPTSSVSAPQVQALMLQQADLAPGMRVLEIGSGGYNAALIAELVGAGGQVTTLDIDPHVTDRAKQLLTRHGYPAVRVATGDAFRGLPDHAPFDAIVVTAGAWDIPSAWHEQLAEGGRLVLPLRLRGLTRSIAFTRRDGHLESRSAHLCGFVPMQGRDAHPTRLLPVPGAPGVSLAFDDATDADPAALRAAAAGSRSEVWTGVSLGVQEPFDALQMWLATQLDGFCTMAVDQARDAGLVDAASPAFSLAAVSGGAFGYLTWRRRPNGAGPRVELGAHALGPHGAALAREIAEHVRSWDQQQRGGPGPVYTAHPATARITPQPDRRIITKRHTQLAITWPAALRGR
ncbi:methyltransferase, FxLD system [Mangrovactinospora gilvigrisea]|uniref:Protein-L-isoaspartate O-methyltransferase n=1 Tax=Mangrovactinospora gilvigrisea TaxID=1428644 RepID=A0A1J7C0S7_9ACTN|nr:methyltransferase, FxLD system [Mangrovactinospora gilvigrisea]OIV39313.1 methyltransferase, FxLD system [Mangrovactinospora gilvigrisea]